MDSRPDRGGDGGPRRFFRELVGQLIEVVQHHRRLDEKQKDGFTLREHYEAGVRAGRRKEEDLIGPPVPEELEYLWVWHAELTRTREMGRYGPKALSYAEIDAFARLTDRSVEPHEVDALLQLDLASRVLTPEPD